METASYMYNCTCSSVVGLCEVKRFVLFSKLLCSCRLLVFRRFAVLPVDSLGKIQQRLVRQDLTETRTGSYQHAVRQKKYQIEYAKQFREKFEIASINQSGNALQNVDLRTTKRDVTCDSPSEVQRKLVQLLRQKLFTRRKLHTKERTTWPNHLHRMNTSS